MPLIDVEFLRKNGSRSNLILCCLKHFCSGKNLNVTIPGVDERSMYRRAGFSFPARINSDCSEGSGTIVSQPSSHALQFTSRQVASLKCVSMGETARWRFVGSGPTSLLHQ